MGFNPARVYRQFDLAANALALLLDLGIGAQRTMLLGYLREQLEEQSFLLPAFAPAIGYEDFLMHELADNYAYEFRNLPHEFHNGGCGRCGMACLGRPCCTKARMYWQSGCCNTCTKLTG